MQLLIKSARIKNPLKTYNQMKWFIKKLQFQVAVLNIKLPNFLNIPKSEDWNTVPNMMMNEDTTYDFTGFVFYQMEGEFKNYNDANIACRILFDGVFKYLII